MRDVWSEPPRRSWLHAVETAALLLLGGIGGAALLYGLLFALWVLAIAAGIET